MTASLMGWILVLVAGLEVQAQELRLAETFVKKDKAAMVRAFFNVNLAREFSDDEIIFRYYLAAEFFCQIPSEAARGLCRVLRDHETLKGQDFSKGLEGFALTPQRQHLIMEVLYALKATLPDLPPPEKEAFENALVALAMAQAKVVAKRAGRADFLSAFEHLEPVVKFYQLTPTYRPYAHILTMLRSWLSSSAADRTRAFVYELEASNDKMTCGLSAFRNLLICSGPNRPVSRTSVHIGLSEAELRRMKINIDKKFDLVCLTSFKKEEASKSERAYVWCFDTRLDSGFCQAAVDPASDKLDYSQWNLSEAPAFQARLSCHQNTTTYRDYRVLFNRDHKLVGVVSDLDFDLDRDRSLLQHMLAKPPSANVGSNAVSIGSAFCSLSTDNLVCSDPGMKTLNLLRFPRKGIRRLRAYNMTLCVEHEATWHWTCRIMPSDSNIGPFPGLNGFLPDGQPVFVAEIERRQVVTIGSPKAKNASELPRHTVSIPRTSPIVFSIDDFRIACGVTNDDFISCRRLETDAVIHIPGIKKGQRLFNTLNNICALDKGKLRCAHKSTLTYKNGVLENKEWHKTQGPVLRDYSAAHIPANASNFLVSEDVICAKEGRGDLHCIETTSGYAINMALAPYDSVLDLPKGDEFCIDSMKSYRCLSQYHSRGPEVKKKND